VSPFDAFRLRPIGVAGKAVSISDAATPLAAVRWYRQPRQQGTCPTTADRVVDFTVVRRWRNRKKLNSGGGGLLGQPCSW